MGLADNTANAAPGAPDSHSPCAIAARHADAVDREGRLPAEALDSLRAREWLGHAGLEEGAPADLVVYPSDPLADLSVLRRPSAVVLRGVRVV